MLDWHAHFCSCVKLEFGPQRFAEGDRLGRDHMHQWPALEAGENRRIDLHDGASAQRRKHVDTYLNEFVFRYNRRFHRHISFEALLGLAAHY